MSIKKIRCPHCDNYDSHGIHKSNRQNYHWGEEETPLFERLVGRDLHYRNRILKCNSCKKTFQIVEMSFDYLEGLVNEVKRLESENASLKSNISEIGAALIDLSKKKET